MPILRDERMNQQQQHPFPSINESTVFKRELNKFKVLQTGFADLNAHLIDSCIVSSPHSINILKYAAVKLAWIGSKLFNKKIQSNNKNILLAPVEADKDRSIGLYKPLLPFLDEKKYDLFAVEQIFSSISISVFFKWLVSIPAIINDVRKALNSVEQYDFLKKSRGMLFIDSLIYSLWIMQLRKFFKHAAYKSVLVDWDRHTLQTLIVIAAKQEKVETFTFVHGAIYTPEKFVPLIANKCLIWGEKHREFFTGLGESGHNLIKAGNSRFSEELPNRESVLLKYKISSEKKIILHASQNFPDLEDHVIIQNLAQLISTNHKFLLVIKSHPSQNYAQLSNRIKHLKNVLLLEPAVTVKESLAIAEFAIIVSSTFSIDALIAGIPVAIFKSGLPLRGIAVDLVEKGNALQLQSQIDFTNLLNDVETAPAESCFDMEAQKNFIKNYCEFYGEESAAIISDILIK